MDKQQTQNTTHNSTSDSRPILFGEVLFDEFEDGSSVLGGAPFNVAWHLNGFGLNPLFITSVGDDDHGKQILETMRQWNMDTSGVQINKTHPTGKVTIKLDQGQPTFNIVPDQAYDNVSPEIISVISKNTSPANSSSENYTSENYASENNASVLYHGTLALRNDVSHQTLAAIRNKINAPVFVDVNLRDPWWDKDTVLPSLDNATWAKLNDDELDEICKMVDISEPDQKNAAIKIQQRFDLDLLIITLGSDGAYFIGSNESYFGEPVPAKNIIDTVGAGDSFSAVTIYGLLHNWSTADISSRAMSFASSICEMRGATTTNKNFYKEIMERW